MFDIGFSEVLAIAIVALLVLGPERLPKAARFAGLWVRRARAHWYSVKTELETEMADEELRRSLQQARSDLEQARESLNRGSAQLQRDLAQAEDDLARSIGDHERRVQDGPADPPAPTDAPAPAAPPEGADGALRDQHGRGPHA